MAGEKRFHRVDAFSRLFDLEKVRRMRNRFVFDWRFFSYSLSDLRRRHHLTALGIGADQFDLDRHVTKPGPYCRVAITPEDVRFELARTRQHPLAARRVVTQRRARHQFIGIRQPARQAALELPRQIHWVVVAWRTAFRTR